VMGMIALSRIEPLACKRPGLVHRYLRMLREGKKAPPIWLEKQRRGSRFAYRIFDGAHRFRAAQRAGHTKIAAIVIAAD
jgi:hypothetical protein